MKANRTALLSVVMLSLFVRSAIATVRNVPTGSSPNYATIQAAVSHSNPGDVINVAAGSYNEAVNINVTGLTLLGIGNPVVDGTGLNSPGITINASGVTVQGFTVRNCHFLFGPVPGILVSDQSLSATIIGNNVTNNDHGIKLIGRSSISPSIDQVNHKVQNNVVTSNAFFGIDVFNLNGSTLVGQNTVSSNGQAGIALAFANGVTVTGNVVQNNGATGVAGLGPDAAGVIIEAAGDTSLGTDPNYLNARPNAVVSNTISGSFGAGIAVDGSVAQTVNWNILSSNGFGIGIDTCVNVEVGFNSITNSADFGIFLQDSGVFCTANNVHNNSVLNGHTDGIHVLEFGGNTTGNFFTLNTALGNTGYDAVDDSGKNRFKVLNTWTLNVFGNSKPSGL